MAGGYTVAKSRQVMQRRLKRPCGVLSQTSLNILIIGISITVMQLTDGSSAQAESCVHELLLPYRTTLGFIINGTADHPMHFAILGTLRVFITKL